MPEDNSQSPDDRIDELLDDPPDEQAPGIGPDSQPADSQQPVATNPVESNSPAPPSANSSWMWPGDLVDQDEVVVATNPHPIQSLAVYMGCAMIFTFSLYLFYIGLSGRADTFVNNIIPILNPGAPEWFLLLPTLIAVVGAGIIGFEYLSRNLTWYIVTDDKVFIRRGIIDREVGKFNFGDLTKVEQSDPFLLRMVDVGHLKLYTASTDTFEASLNYVAEPATIRDAMDTTDKTDS